MDLRKWFLLHDGPDLEKQLNKAIHHFPCSEFRCPAVLEVFIAGFGCGFKLTDKDGQPTEALRVMVKHMKGAELVTADQLSKQDRTHLTDVPKGTLMDVLIKRWYIRGISERLYFDGAATGNYGWAWHMFRSVRGKQGLRFKRLTDVVDGVKTRRMRYLAECVPDWELSDSVYEGIWKYTYSHHAKLWNAYGYLAGRGSTQPGGSAGTGVRQPETAGASA
ncbi:MAG TPA: hypothetical protein VD969_19700 [Symbiobacteriaceae bacterium]|nr:hypothetical protein [Symbiobacteriaceae bacterium]